VPRQDSKIIHIDIDPNEIGRNYATSVGILGDAKLALRDLIDTVKEWKDKPAKKSDRPKEIKDLLEEWHNAIEPHLNSESTPINPHRLMKEINNIVDSRTIVVSDASYSTLWWSSHLNCVVPGRTLLSPRGLGGIGSGFPLALGAKLAAPNKRVLCISGDGGFGYAYKELETAARHRISVVTVILNNSCLGMQKDYERFVFGKAMGCDLLDVDYSKLAEVLGCKGARIEKPSELRDALKTAFESDQPYVLDVKIDPNILPPNIFYDRFLT